MANVWRGELSGFTIAKRVAFAGFGLRSGRRVRVELAPAETGSGIIFNHCIRVNFAVARVASLKPYASGVILKGKGMVVGPVEHFLAACYCLGVSDIAVGVDGEELPFGDGSALPFLRVLRRAGLRPVGAKNPPLFLSSPVGVTIKNGLIVAMPARRLTVSCIVRLPPGRREEWQFFSSAVNPVIFEKQITPARTFGPFPGSRVKWLEERLGFRLKWKDGWLFPAKARFANEVCRHKVLDLLGDLALLARDLRAAIFAFQPSHRLNLKLVQRLKEMEVKCEYC